MSRIICLIDTSVFVTILNVPKLNRDRDEILNTFEKHKNRKCKFMLPIATILETGNHIAQNGDGRQRRDVANLFIQEVRDTFDGKAPYTISECPLTNDFARWLSEFPELAMREIGFGDLTIIKEFERFCAISPAKEIFIWSLDNHLTSYHQKAKV